jgi:hypothetical protein
LTHSLISTKNHEPYQAPFPKTPKEIGKHHKTRDRSGRLSLLKIRNSGDIEAL